MGYAEWWMEPESAGQSETHSEDGVDLTLIRRLLKLTPAERLALGVANSQAMLEFVARARRIK